MYDVCKEFLNYSIAFLAQLWKKTCDDGLENKKLKRKWIRNEEQKFSVTDDFVKTLDTKKLMSVKSEGDIQVVELDYENKKDKDSQKWTKSDIDDNKYFTLTNPRSGKLLTAKEQDKLTLEGTVVIKILAQA